MTNLDERLMVHDSTCSLEGCLGRVVARGMCRSHYGKWWHADRKANGPRPSFEAEQCSIPDCEKPSHCRTWCASHYKRWQAHGDPLGGAFRATYPRGDLCSVDRCTRTREGGAYCGMHWYRLRKFGDPGAAEPTRSMELVHGTVAGYRHRGCRCEECREARRLYEIEYRKRNREAVRAAQVRKVASDPERQRQYRRRSKRKRPNSNRTSQAARAAAPYTPDAVIYAGILEGDPCAFCGSRPVEIDHIVPLAQGGISEWDNLAPACASCNRSKGAKSLLGYLLYRSWRSEVLASSNKAT